ncbi:LexA family transcriptional regulator, partial [Clostridium botulinum]|nr:LexA family transcriptional regulator [Clostridium botulinum]
MQLNIEQKRIIANKPNGHSLIKGVAGSGKTTVAVNKIPLLLRHYCPLNDDKVLMLNYNKSLK